MTLAPRLLAGLVDLCLVVALMTAILATRTTVSGLLFVLITLAAVSTLVFYFAIPEMIWQTTPGKLLFGLRVVTADGERPTFHQTLIRAMTRLPEAFMLSYILLINGNPRHQRLGDAMSETYVVRKHQGADS